MTCCSVRRPGADRRESREAHLTRGTTTGRLCDVIVGSYGYNAWLGESHYRVAGHAGIPVVFDCRSARAWPTHYDDPPEYEGQFGRPSPVLIYMRTVCLNRHNGGINMLFRDWSVRKVGLKENWTLKWHPEFDTSGPWTMAGGVQPEDWPEWMRRFKEY